MKCLYRKSVYKLCFIFLFIIIYLCFSIRNVFDISNVGVLEKHSFTISNHTKSFIDIDSLKLIHSSNLCVYVKPKIVILITSHVSNIGTRDIIRRSCPRDLFAKFNALQVFLIAVRDDDGKRNKNIENEFREHGDIVQGDFIEAYRNLTWKHLMGLRWTHDYCKTVLYIVKMDDDIVVNYYKLFEIINKFKSKFDLLGHRIEHTKPIRDITNKWYVSGNEFSAEEYPTFLSGWLYIMTMEAASSILRASKEVPYFWIDDVLVSGLLREKAKLKLMDISYHFRYEPKNIECCIENKYSCDFLAAPNGKNSALHLQLSNHLWECRYKKLCVLESSLQKSCWSTVTDFSVKGHWMVQELNK